jgi:hypothetical protein
MNEKRHERSMHRSRIRWPRLISYQKGGLPNGSPKLSMTSVLAEALPQEDPQVAKAAFAIRRTTCRANGIRQFYLEAGAGPPVILLHGRDQLRLALPDSSTCARNDAREVGCESKKSNRVHAGRRATCRRVSV